MPSGTLRRCALAWIVACAAAAAACGGGGLFRQQYEYEEEIYLQLDGAATAYINASVPALVALRGVDLKVDPLARVDRDRIRALFSAPGVKVATPTYSRRHGRRFLHVRVEVANVRDLQRVAPFSWSTYRFERQGDVLAYRQAVGKATGRNVGDVGWTGDEMVRFKMHLPSEIPFNNSPKPTQRGNILEWEQTLKDRAAGVPLDIEVNLEPESILQTTLLLFGGTIVAAALTFAVVIWWVVRKGRKAEIAESGS
ncbi:MAG TPA: hypothetical protein VL173_07395 [Vicinamibacterales bacterium]|jgi:hypothetical protein|nr:hypothetical protein [Vicinamibacterales bacterium]